MSLHAVNTTDFDHGPIDESGSNLSPGHIALITILSTFVFFITIMLIVCIGEHCQYSKGRKKQGAIRKSKRHTAHTDTDLQTNSKCNSISELTSAIVQPNPSVSTNIERQHSYTRTFENAQKASSNMISQSQHQSSGLSQLTVPSSRTNRDNNKDKGNNDNRVTTKREIEELTEDDEKYVDSFESVTITMDCDNMCDRGDIGSSLPLLEQTSDVDGGDGEIFCDSSDFRDFRLEADV